jgi:hypothetical protein
VSVCMNVCARAGEGAGVRWIGLVGSVCVCVVGGVSMFTFWACSFAFPFSFLRQLQEAMLPPVLPPPHTPDAAHQNVHAVAEEKKTQRPRPRPQWCWWRRRRRRRQRIDLGCTVEGGGGGGGGMVVPNKCLLVDRGSGDMAAAAECGCGCGCGCGCWAGQAGEALVLASEF